MGAAIRYLIIFLIIYFLVRRLLKPFREFKKQVQQSQRVQTKEQKFEGNSVTENVGEYIDYEEIKD